MSTTTPQQTTHTDNSSLTLTSSSGLLSPELYQRLFYIFLGTALSVVTLGITANIANIMVYFRMGFVESSNISMTALAISDLGIVVTALFSYLFYILPVSVLQPLTAEVSLTTLTYPHHALTRVSAMITTFLSVERYLCVHWPLKVKDIMTPRRTMITMVVIFVFTLLPMLIIFFRYPMGWKYFPQYDRALIGVLPEADPTILLSFDIFQWYDSTILPLATFFTVSVLTVLLTASLRNSRKWRESAKAAPASTIDQKTAAASSAGTKEAKAIKMVVVIATVFIAASVPSCIQVLLKILVPGYDVTGRYSEIWVLYGCFYFNINCVNCTANILIYYKMSTKFRKAFLDLFSLRENVTANQTF